MRADNKVEDGLRRFSVVSPAQQGGKYERPHEQINHAIGIYRTWQFARRNCFLNDGAAFAASWQIDFFIKCRTQNWVILNCQHEPQKYLPVLAVEKFDYSQAVFAQTLQRAATFSIGEEFSSLLKISL